MPIYKCDGFCNLLYPQLLRLKYKLELPRKDSIKSLKVKDLALSFDFLSQTAGVVSQMHKENYWYV